MLILLLDGGMYVFAVFVVVSNLHVLCMRRNLSQVRFGLKHLKNRKLQGVRLLYWFASWLCF